MRDPDACARLGAGLRAIREAQGLSQVNLSKASGVSRSSISAIERGRQEPTFRTLMRLRDGLGVPIADALALYDDSRHVGG
jgi:transcriptional regulator with XRE-family HTH domain